MMHRRRIRRPSRWLTTVIAVFAAAGLFIVTYVNRPDPPLAVIAEAHRSIQRAGAGAAATYFPNQIRIAEELVANARKATDAESGRFYLLRDYSAAAWSASRARLVAAGADSAGRVLHESLRVASGAGIRDAERAMKDLTNSLRRMPRERQYRQRVTRFEVTLGGARNLYREGSYREALRLTGGIVADAARLEDTVHKRYAGWTSSVPKWRRWAADTIRWSRDHRAAAVIVRKIDHTCDLYESGKLVASYEADLGVRWMGDKMHRGDNATPEGTYKITRKKGTRETKYYKALLLNYPNEEDVASFRVARKNGHIPGGAGIGGLIEIHGDGGRGEDWTQGCVALNNGDMDRLYARVNVGTPVTIIGSDGIPE